MATKSDEEADVPSNARVRRGSETKRNSPVREAELLRRRTVHVAELLSSDSTSDSHDDPVEFIDPGNSSKRNHKRKYRAVVSKSKGRSKNISSMVNQRTAGRSMNAKRTNRMKELDSGDSTDEGGAEVSSDSDCSESLDIPKRRGLRGDNSKNYPAKVMRNRRGASSKKSREDCGLDMSDSDSYRCDGKKESPPHYRCNLQSAIRELQSLKLRSTHMDSIKSTPFWYLIDAAIHMDNTEYSMYKKGDACIASIINQYVAPRPPSLGGFKIAGHIDITELISG